MMFDQALATCTRSLGYHEGQEAFCDGIRFHGPVLFVPSRRGPAVLAHAFAVREHSLDFEVLEVDIGSYFDDRRFHSRSFVTPSDSPRPLTITGNCDWECAVELTFSDTCIWDFEQYSEVMAALKRWLRSLLNVEQGSDYQKECWE